MYELIKFFEDTASILRSHKSKLSPEILRKLSYNVKTASELMYKGEDIDPPIMNEQEKINQLLCDLVEDFEHDQKVYNELLFDLVFGLMAAKETSDQDEWYRTRIMLLYKVMMDLGQCLFPNSYKNQKPTAKLKAI